MCIESKRDCPSNKIWKSTPQKRCFIIVFFFLHSSKLCFNVIYAQWVSPIHQIHHLLDVLWSRCEHFVFDYRFNYCGGYNVKIQLMNRSANMIPCQSRHYIEQCIAIILINVYTIHVCVRPFHPFERYGPLTQTQCTQHTHVMYMLLYMAIHTLETMDWPPDTIHQIN